jgi:hypothetical protein
LPAASVALTEKAWEPVASELYVFAEVQLPQDPESSLHWKVELLSVAEKEKLAVVAVVVAAGLELIAVSGAVVSAGGAGACTAQLRVAGEASVLPAVSIAFTEKVCEPTARPL